MNNYFQQAISQILCDLKNLQTKIAKKIAILWEGDVQTDDVTSINFTGPCVTVTENSDNVEVNIDCEGTAGVITTLTDTVDGHLIGRYTNEELTVVDIDETITSIIQNDMSEGSHQIGEYIDENGDGTDLYETTTTLTLDEDTNTYTYTSENGTEKSFRIPNEASLTPNGDGTYTYIASDGTTTLIEDILTRLVDNGNGTLTYTDEDDVDHILNVGGVATTILNDTQVGFGSPANTVMGEPEFFYNSALNRMQVPFIRTDLIQGLDYSATNFNYLDLDVAGSGGLNARLLGFANLYLTTAIAGGAIHLDASGTSGGVIYLNGNIIEVSPIRAAYALNSAPDITDSFIRIINTRTINTGTFGSDATYTGIVYDPNLLGTATIDHYFIDAASGKVKLQEMPDSGAPEDYDFVVRDIATGVLQKASIVLEDTFVGFGSPTDKLTGESHFTYISATDKLTVGSASPSPGTIGVLGTGIIDTEQVRGITFPGQRILFGSGNNNYDLLSIASIGNAESSIRLVTRQGYVNFESRIRANETAGFGNNIGASYQTVILTPEITQSVTATASGAVGIYYNPNLHEINGNPLGTNYFCKAPQGDVNFAGIVSRDYIDDTAATEAGLIQGDLYHDDGDLKIVKLATPAPFISSFLPTSGTTGTVVTITGTGFISQDSILSVVINLKEVSSFTWVNSTTITAVVASGTAASGSVYVTTTAGQHNKATFTYTAP